jgi:poly(A) polymerase
MSERPPVAPPLPGTPRLIPRADHAISRAFVSPNALKTLYRINAQGFRAYLVGGCVRDLWLGREPKDFDVVTDATPRQIKRIFRNCRLVGRRFRLAHLHFQDELIEVATFRSPVSGEPEEEAEEGGERPAAADVVAEGSEPPGRPTHFAVDETGMVLRDNVFGNPEEDALRRDFTVNALFYDITDFSLIDYVGGVEDLQRGVIRTIGEAEERFIEDPVRMLRAVRFAAMLGFTIEEATLAALLRQAPTITRSTPPRLYEEVLKLFLLGEGERTYQLLRQTGLFAPLFPVFSAWLDRESDGFPHTGISRALDWIDSRIQTGGSISPTLLCALLFGQFLEEQAELRRTAGSPPGQAIQGAVADFLEGVAATVRIPKAVGLAVREILAGQYRLRKIPGKRAQAFVQKPIFAEILDYLRFTSLLSGEGGDRLAWWEQFAAGSGESPPILGPEGPAQESRPKRRRRRRKGRATPREGAP